MLQRAEEKVVKKSRQEWCEELQEKIDFLDSVIESKLTPLQAAALKSSKAALETLYIAMGCRALDTPGTVDILGDQPQPTDT